MKNTFIILSLTVLFSSGFVLGAILFYSGPTVTLNLHNASGHDINMIKIESNNEVMESENFIHGLVDGKSAQVQFDASGGGVGISVFVETEDRNGLSTSTLIVSNYYIGGVYEVEIK